MFKLLCKDLWFVIKEIARSMMCLVITLGIMIFYIVYLALFPVIQICMSIYYVGKYVFRNHRLVMHATKEELQRVIEPNPPKKYYCLGLRLNNYLVDKLAKKRLETL